MGFTKRGTEGHFTVIRVPDDFQMQLAPWGTEGYDHYAFSVSQNEFGDIFSKVKKAAIPYGQSFSSVGTNVGPGVESGAKRRHTAVYLNDPNKHLIEIRAYRENP